MAEARDTTPDPGRNAPSTQYRNHVNAMLGSSAPDDFIFGGDRSKLSPEFASLDREFGEALAEETAAYAAEDYTPAGRARLALATERVMEVKQRIDGTEMVYVKDQPVRMRAAMWFIVRTRDLLYARIEARMAARKRELQ